MQTISGAQVSRMSVLFDWLIVGMLSLPGLPQEFLGGWALKWFELQCTVITSKWFLLSKSLAHWLWAEFVNFLSSVMMTCYFFPIILNAAREIREWPFILSLKPPASSVTYSDSHGSKIPTGGFPDPRTYFRGTLFSFCFKKLIVWFD